MWLHHLRADEAGHEIKWLAPGQNTNWGGLYYTSSHDYHTITPSRVPFLTVKNASIFLLFPIGIFLHGLLIIRKDKFLLPIAHATATFYGIMNSYFSFMGLHMNSSIEFCQIRPCSFRIKIKRLDLRLNESLPPLDIHKLLSFYEMS